jgi:hypothetical protein
VRHPHDPQLVGPTRLDRVVEVVLTAGLGASALLLLAGLLTTRHGLLWGGVLALLLTPVARVIVTTIGFIDRQDWLFAAVSAWILGVLCFSFFVAARL